MAGGRPSSPFLSHRPIAADDDAAAIVARLRNLAPLTAVMLGMWAWRSRASKNAGIARVVVFSRATTTRKSEESLLKKCGKSKKKKEKKKKCVALSSFFSQRQTRRRGSPSLPARALLTPSRALFSTQQNECSGVSPHRSCSPSARWPRKQQRRTLRPPLPRPQRRARATPPKPEQKPKPPPLLLSSLLPPSPPPHRCRGAGPQLTA